MKSLIVQNKTDEISRKKIFYGFKSKNVFKFFITISFDNFHIHSLKIFQNYELKMFY